MKPKIGTEILGVRVAAYHQKYIAMPIPDAEVIQSGTALATTHLSDWRVMQNSQAESMKLLAAVPQGRWQDSSRAGDVLEIGQTPREP